MGKGGVVKKAQRDAEKAVLTKLRRQLKNRKIDESGNPDVPGVATAHGFNQGLKVAIQMVNELLRGDSKSRRNAQGR